MLQLLLALAVGWLGILMACLCIESTMDEPRYTLAVKFASFWPIYLFTDRPL